MRFITVNNVHTSQILRINMDYVVKYTSKDTGTIIVFSNGEVLQAKETVEELDKGVV